MEILAVKGLVNHRKILHSLVVKDENEIIQ